jgi:hypothetical protein
VGDIPGDPAYLAEHKDRIFVHTWGGFYQDQYEGSVLVMSPRFGSDRMLTAADAGGWKVVWAQSEYEVEPAAFVLGGARASCGSWLYWATMQVPGMGALDFCEQHPCTEPTDMLAAFLGTLRPTAIFRGKDCGTKNQEVELLYGSPYLPKYDEATAEWTIVPNNMGGEWPSYGFAGINNLCNTYTWWMNHYHGRLFVGTFDWLYLGVGAVQHLLGVQIPEKLYALGTNFFGADFYRFVSQDLPALPISLNGAGNYTNYGIRTMVQAGNQFFIGTANAMNMLTDPAGPLGGWELREVTIQDCDGYGEGD